MRTLVVHQGAAPALVLTSEGNEVALIYTQIKNEMIDPTSRYEFVEFTHSSSLYLLNISQVSRAVLT